MQHALSLKMALPTATKYCLSFHPDLLKSFEYVNDSNEQIIKHQ